MTAKPDPVSTAFNTVTAAAKAATENPDEKPGVNTDTLIPETLTSAQLRDLAKRLKLHDWDLDTNGDRGIDVLDRSLFHSCLYRLAKRDDGAAHLVDLLIDPELSWDAGGSLRLQDALVKCGPAAIPDLRRAGKENRLAVRCIELIERGARTAI